MPRSRPPLLEGQRLAWIFALLTALALTLLVLSDSLAPGTAVLLHVVALALITYALFALDKRRARKAARRVSEANLLWLVVLGGAAGAWLAMRKLRHKTKHMRFRILVPLAAIAHVVLVTWLAVRSS